MNFFPQKKAKLDTQEETTTREPPGGEGGEPLLVERQLTLGIAVTSMDQYISGTILAVALGFAALYGLFLRRYDGRRDAAEKIDNYASATTNTTAVIDGERRSRDSDVDVIIVGAGVAGSALAHTLGKVQFLFFCLFVHF